jgi:hypothetical protein
MWSKAISQPSPWYQTERIAKQEGAQNVAHHLRGETELLFQTRRRDHDVDSIDV